MCLKVVQKYQKAHKHVLKQHPLATDGCNQGTISKDPNYNKSSYDLDLNKPVMAVWWAWKLKEIKREGWKPSSVIFAW